MSTVPETPAGTVVRDDPAGTGRPGSPGGEVVQDHPAGTVAQDHPAGATARDTMAGVQTIVGRGAELDRMAGVLRAAGHGSTRTVLLAGEAGIGKTSAIAAFLAAVGDDVTVIRGECVPLGGDGLPYAPIIGVLGELADRFGPTQVLDWAGAGAPELSWLVPALATEPSTGTERVDGSRPQSRIRLYETVARVLERAAGRTPLLMIIEDLHWADDSTRHLISFLLRAVTDAPLLMIFSYRSDELTRRHPLRPFLAEVRRLAAVEAIELTPLAGAELTAMINSVAAGADPYLIKRIMDSSGGVPYFAVELARASVSDGELPETLRDTLLLRVSTVTEDCQQLLRRLSIAGTRIDHRLAVAVHDGTEAELDATLREAVEANLLIADGDGYAFRHALLREALHSDLLPGEHTRLHRLFGTVLEDRPDLLPPSLRPVELAHHWHAARDNERAFSWSVVAARSQSHGFAEALRHYERALEVWDVIAEPEQVAGGQPELLDEAAEAARNAGELDRALALTNEALRLTDRQQDPLAAAARLADRSRMLNNLMQPGVLETIDEAVALVPAEPPSRLRADVLSRRASLTMLLDKERSIDRAQQAIAAATAASEPSLEAHGRITLASALIGLGLDTERGLAEFAAARALIDEEPPDATVSVEYALLRYFINYSDALTSLGRYSDALELAAQGHRVAAGYGLERRTGVMLAGNAAEAAIALGDWATARRLTESALRLKPPGNHFVQLRLLQAELAIWADDDPDRAAELLAEVERFARLDVTGPDYLGQGNRVHLALALARADAVRAWELAESMLEQVPWWEPTHELQVLGLAAMAYGMQPDPPPHWADRLRAALRDRPDTLIGRQWLPLVAAELEQTPEGWQAATATLTEADAPVLNVLHARYRTAAALLALGRTDAAAEAIRVARDGAERVGIGLLLRRLRLLEGEAGLAPTSGTTTGGEAAAGLTDRERQVLVLVADGLSNRQIGERLVISTKTASVHVSNILAKLGVGSRGAAAARYRRDGPSADRSH